MTLAAWWSFERRKHQPDRRMLDMAEHGHVCRLVDQDSLLVQHHFNWDSVNREAHPHGHAPTGSTAVPLRYISPGRPATLNHRFQPAAKGSAFRVNPTPALAPALSMVPDVMQSTNNALQTRPGPRSGEPKYQDNSIAIVRQVWQRRPSQALHSRSCNLRHGHQSHRHRRPSLKQSVPHT